MKKLLMVLFFLSTLVAMAQTISKKVNIYWGIKDSEGYECMTAKVENGDTTITFWVMNDAYFPAEDPIFLLANASKKKANNTLKKYLEISDKLDSDMDYTDKKTKIMVSKKVHFDNDTILYISNDLVKFHAFSPKRLRQIIHEMNSFYSDPHYKGPLKRYID